MESHPLRMRGLKRYTDRVERYCLRVASFTDAWIETTLILSYCICLGVASFTDAWIETWLCMLTYNQASVASFTDAWIETGGWQPMICVLGRRILYGCVDWNFPYQSIKIVLSVASFTDAWIETSNSELVQGRCVCRILYGCVDWNFISPARSTIVRSRILYGCVDWNRPWIGSEGVV